jgi:hypothetical protein
MTVGGIGLLMLLGLVIGEAITAMSAAKVERFAVSLELERRRFVDVHPADWVLRHHSLLPSHPV